MNIFRWWAGRREERDLEVVNARAAVKKSEESLVQAMSASGRVNNVSRMVRSQSDDNHFGELFAEVLRRQRE